MDVLEAVIGKLEQGEYKSALDVIADSANDTMIKVQTMDLISLIAGNLSDDNAENKPDLYTTSETLLHRLALKCTPQEVLFELIEKLGNAPSDEVFTSLLKVAQVAILRLPAKNARCIEWVFNTIMEYLEKIPLPENVNKDMDEEEEVLLENDETVRRWLQLYLTMHLFLEPITKHLDRPSGSIFFETILNQKNALICFVLQLMGKLFPLLHLQRTEQPRRMPRERPLPAAKSYSIQVAEDMASLILTLVKDPLFLLPYGERRTMYGRKRTNTAVRLRDEAGDDEEQTAGNDCFLNHEKYKVEGLAVLYYLLLGENLLPASVPQVYEARYIFEMGLYYVVQLVSSERTLVYFKGIRLAQALVRLLRGIELTAKDLDAQIHSTFCKRFIRALERTGSVRNREVGLAVLTQYIHSFDDEGRYTVIAFMLKKFEDDSVRSFAISCYKNLVCDAIRQNKSDTPLPRWYSGEVLRDMLTKHICVLKHGVKTDLLDNSYSITSAISALWVLLKTDQANHSHVWDYFDVLENHFLLELRTALDLSRAHYQSELKATVDGNHQQLGLEPATELTISTLNGGEQPPVLTREKKVDICKQMLLRLDMLDFNLARLNREIGQIKEKQCNR
ncbi:glomulin [Anopheles ziemanni]|uniref:glomulin n=1 Tax=Anopheles coustani TaxID=139045 RepID=UPI002659EC48|nr:glomulin [Anopheles coustani]XP_058166264.1 glomulin [Anopheles ziemanni]